MITVINHTTTFRQEVHKGGRIFKPLILEFSVAFPDNLDVNKILQFAQIATASGTNPIAAIPLWIKEAKQLGLTVTFNLAGSFFDPVRLVTKFSYWLSEYVLNKVGEKKYREMFNIQ